MVKLLVIADDFTGALDTGVQFSKAGIPTMVSIRSDLNYEEISGDIQVLVLDVESRHLNPEEAYERVRSAVQRALEADVAYIYKKTDSTLRGNIGSELNAAIDALGGTEVMFIPAYPKTGRTTVNGYHYVNGIPVHETSFAKDPLNPVDISYIPDIIARQSDMKVKLVTNTLCQVVEEELHKGIIFVFDAESEDDLASIGDFLKDRGRLKLTAGCAGFAQILQTHIDFERKVPEKKQFGGNFLIVCGSVNEASLKQVKYAENEGYPCIALTAEQKLSLDYWEGQEGREELNTIAAAIEKQGKLIIKSVGSREEAYVFDKIAEEAGLPAEQISMHIAKIMGYLVKELTGRVDMGTLVVFGGDTAMGIMDAIGCKGIVPGEEIVPGVPVSQIQSDRSSLNMVSKAGGFGNVDVVHEIEKYLNKNKIKI